MQVSIKVLSVSYFCSIPLVIDDYGLEKVQEYMHHIRSNAETSVRNLLRQVVRNAGKNILYAIDYLDDGSPVSEMKRSHSHRC